jgi:hypothetical protein
MFVLIWEAGRRRWFWDGERWTEAPGEVLVYEDRDDAKQDLARMRAQRPAGVECQARIKELEAPTCK